MSSPGTSPSSPATHRADDEFDRYDTGDAPTEAEGVEPPPATGNDRVDEVLREVAGELGGTAGEQASRLAAAHDALAQVLEHSRNPHRPDNQNPIPGLQPRPGQPGA